MKLADTQDLGSCIVRCAGSSPVIRTYKYGGMLKLADGADSKSVAEMRVGSSPTIPTNYILLFLCASLFATPVLTNRKDDWRRGQTRNMLM